MDGIRSRQIIIAGAGIAGLTAALAFAARGFSVQVFEKSLELTEVGAGLQLSPNATRTLSRLGVLRMLGRSPVRPSAVLLRDAATLAELARIPLGDAAETRWKAPYLVVHRADLQKALLKAAEREAEIRITLGATVRDVAVHQQGVTASIDLGSTIRDARGLLLVGADGVWSSLRNLAGQSGRSRFSRQVAWRRTIRSDAADAALFGETAVTAFLHRGFHLVAYPVRAGSAINLVAFTKGDAAGENWSGTGDPERLVSAMRGTSPALVELARTGEPWTTWPIHTVRPGQPYVAGASMALIGDAAHAMTPFAAQGAAMGIEDAETLAACVATTADDLAPALRRWEANRRARIGRVRSRGAFNRFVWHAAGPVALVRNEVLRRRGPARLMADLDWLYGYDAASDAPDTR